MNVMIFGETASFLKGDGPTILTVLHNHAKLRSPTSGTLFLNGWGYPQLCVYVCVCVSWLRRS